MQVTNHIWLLVYSSYGRTVRSKFAFNHDGLVGADSEGGMRGCIPPPAHGGFFIATKYRQSLAYLTQRPINNSAGMPISVCHSMLLATFTKCQLSLDGQLRRQTAISSSDYTDSSRTIVRDISEMGYLVLVLVLKYIFYVLVLVLVLGCYVLVPIKIFFNC